MDAHLRALDAAVADIESGAFSVAVARLRALLQRHPDNATARLVLARALIHQGRVEDAAIVVRPLLTERRVLKADRAVAEAVWSLAGTAAGDPSAVDATRSAIAAGTPPGLGATVAWGTTAMQRYQTGDLHGAVDAAARGVSACGADSAMLRTEAVVTLAMMLMHVDRFADAEALLVVPTGRPEAEAARSLRQRALGSVCFHGGRWDEAGVLLDARRDLAVGVEIADNERALAAGLLAVLFVHQDRLEDARRVLADAAGPFAPGHGLMLGWAGALLAEAEGDAYRASQLADRLIGAVERTRSIVRFRLFGPDLVRLCLVRGDTGRARVVSNHLQVIAAEARTPSVTAAAMLCSGLVHRDAAEVARAAELYAASPRPLERAIALDASARLSGDEAVDHAVDAEKAALAIYRRVGAVRDARRVRARLRRRGVVEIERRPPREPAGFGWPALSPAERAVARLVADGLTNADIAARLYVSPRTVETHVAHLFRKLGVASRAGVAAIATRSAADSTTR